MLGFFSLTYLPTLITNYIILLWKVISNRILSSRIFYSQKLWHFFPFYFNSFFLSLQIKVNIYLRSCSIRRHIPLSDRTYFFFLNFFWNVHLFWNVDALRSIKKWAVISFYLERKKNPISWKVGETFHIKTHSCPLGTKEKKY